MSSTIASLALTNGDMADSGAAAPLADGTAELSGGGQYAEGGAENGAACGTGSEELTNGERCLGTLALMAGGVSRGIDGGWGQPWTGSGWSKSRSSTGR